MTRLDEIAGDSAELGSRIASVIHERLFVMRDAVSGLPGAQSFEGDRTSGHTTVLDERGFAMPAVSDPTGEAGIRKDVARDDRRQLERHLLAAYRANDAAAKILARYAPRSATDKERTETAKANEQGCPSCARTEVVHGVKRCEPVAKDGLCRFCYEYRRDTGTVPTVEQVQAHHRSETVRRPA